MTNPNDAAVEALRNAVSLAPNNVELANQLIKLLIDLLRYPEAEESARLALQHHPRSVALQLSLADVYCRQGKDSHALAIVETLVSGKDADPRAHGDARPVAAKRGRYSRRGGDLSGSDRSR